MAAADAATVFLETTLGTRLVVSFPAYATTVADLKSAFSPPFLLPLTLSLAPSPLKNSVFFGSFPFDSTCFPRGFYLGIFGHELKP
jgi:hypothetical protein